MSETIYSAKQLAAEMRLSSAMVRKYAQAFEAITGERIAIIGRDGRHFTQEQHDTMIRARAFLDANPGMSVDMGMRAALGRAEIAAKRPGGELGIGALVEALGEVAAPLQAELSGIREGLVELPELRREIASLRFEVAELRGVVAEARALPESSLLPYAPRRLGRPIGFANGGNEPDESEDDPDDLGGKQATPERDRNDGVLVRFARRLEKLLGRR